MWPNQQFPADLVTFTKEIFNGKLHFLCNEFSIGNKNVFATIVKYSLLLQ